MRPTARRRMRSCCLRPDRTRGGFTLLEALATLVVVLVTFVFLGQFMGTVNSAWKSGASDPFEEAQAAFESIAQNLSAATLEPYRGLRRFRWRFFAPRPARTSCPTTWRSVPILPSSAGRAPARAAFLLPRAARRRQRACSSPRPRARPSFTRSPGSITSSTRAAISSSSAGTRARRDFSPAPRVCAGGSRKSRSRRNRCRSLPPRLPRRGSRDWPAASRRLRSSPKT